MNPNDAEAMHMMALCIYALSAGVVLLSWRLFVTTNDLRRTVACLNDVTARVVSAATRIVAAVPDTMAARIAAELRDSFAAGPRPK